MCKVCLSLGSIPKNLNLLLGCSNGGQIWTVCVIAWLQIPEKVKPHPLVVSFLTIMEKIIPKWKIVPTKDIIDSTFKDPVKRQKVTKILEPLCWWLQYVFRWCFTCSCVI
jgi:hypothetical protein